MGKWIASFPRQVVMKCPVLSISCGSVDLTTRLQVPDFPYPGVDCQAFSL